MLFWNYLKLVIFGINYRYSFQNVLSPKLNKWRYYSIFLGYYQNIVTGICGIIKWAVSINTSVLHVLTVDVHSSNAAVTNEAAAQ